MATEPNHVVVVQDASKELNLRVFEWAMNGLSLKKADTVTLLAILHEIYTPMGYKIAVDDRTMVGLNHRIISEELERKKEEYQNHEELSKVAKLYESSEVSLKIKLFTGSSLKDVAFKAVINLKATWLILDRQMKKDEEFFLQRLSCGISRLKRKNQIVRVRGPLNKPDEIPCNSHERDYEDSLPENPFSIDIVPRGLIKVDGLNLAHYMLDEEEGFTTNINENTCQTGPAHQSMHERDINSDQMICETEGDKPCQDLEQAQNMFHDDEDITLEINNYQATAQEIANQPSQEGDRKSQNSKKTQKIPHDDEDTKLIIRNYQATSQEIADQPSQEVEKTQIFLQDEEWDLRHPTKSKEVIYQTEDDQLSQNPAQQTEKNSHGDILDGGQQKSNLEKSMCSICSVCKSRRPNVEWRKEFTYEELQAATDGFSLKNSLSECGYLFSTFKGQLEGELKIVVKQHEITNTQIREKIKSEVQTILKARHKNVVMLLGSFTKDHFLLSVYEYACNGSLDKYLSRESCRLLTWIERLRVAMGLARGLKYLHDNDIIHGNIKPSNILLTHDFKPLLGDFGFGKKHEFKSSKNKNLGNSEYIAPEFQEKGKLSTKSDVYSFGVIILELITGRKATDKISGVKSLVGWAKPLLGGKKYSELLDPTIRNSYEDDQLRWLGKVTAQCLKKSPKERLSMNMVVSALQGIAGSEECHITENFTSASSCSRLVPDMNGSQIQAPTSQGTEDSRKCYMTEDFTQAVSHSGFLPDINGSQGPIEVDQPSQNEEKIESSSFLEEGRLRLIVENSHFYMIGNRNSDTLNQFEDQMHIRPQGVESSPEKMIKNNHIMDEAVPDQLSEFEEHMKSHGDGKTQKISINHMTGQTIVDQLSQDQEEEMRSVQKKRELRPAPVSGMTDETKEDHLIQDKTQLQSSYHENLLDGHQDDTVLENSKFSACSICKSKRPKIARMKHFPYEELLEATEGFSVVNSLSETEDGPTFKGLLKNNVKVVVKKYKFTRSEEEKIFQSEVQLLINARHKNVTMLLGLCTDENQLMIVYEQVCNGSLDHYLSRGSFQSLTWTERTKVAIGTARGLKYLHENHVIHGNIKASNILLTHNFEPLIGDFGFGKVKLEQKKSNQDKSAIDSGITAPEYQESGKPSTKADVYSFGVLLLELITGRRATDKLPGGKKLIGWARPLLGGKKYPQLLDPKISNSYDEEQLLWLVQVTEKCLKKNPKERFTMNMVVSSLQGIAESTESSVIEDSSPEKSSLPSDEPEITDSQGQMEDDPVSWEQEQIDRNTYLEERNRLETKTNHMIGQSADQLIQDAEEIQRKPHREEISVETIIRNRKIAHTNPDSSTAYTTHCESCKHTQGEERTSSKVCQRRKRRESYGGAKDFFLQGAQEYTVCQEFFTLIDSTS